ncbi:MAG: hypothetical protein JNL10_09360 [Verrucomicrobiales bacterium]|nr:hypothetical protein [Verrucomicrobiales bacterium]
MNSKELFRLAIRLLGLGFVYLGLAALPASSSAILAGMLGGNLYGFLFTVFTALWPLCVAYWLLRGAPLLMQIAYPEASPVSKEDASTAGALGAKVDA